ncbi:ATPase [Sulfitobacter sp. M85]|nr:ATPase [Sulfitobacter sp. Ks11]MDF3387852.1 ATPase [Sulfitobacter sp. M85]MDF3391272.1 ATPase [Sulfitobacter sp. Ks16]MDF3401910.1 ATPase [Sulfitobacter sp. KE39]MDF3405331.1 ATPase [Sulfitobacter sp. Ks35]MDF3412409.1 ATPase [Sulfitobacter sp. KE38]
MLDPVYWTVLAVSTIAAAVAFWTLKFQEFHGKIYYALTFLGMIWTLMMVGAEAATPAYDCQMQQAQLAWLGHGLVPVAWSFFIFEYVGPSSRSRGWVSLLALIAVPLAAFGLAATNDWHHLIYTAETALQPGDDQITFEHGPGYFLVLAVLYCFVMATLIGLGRAFFRAKRAAWPLLTMLVVITLIPLGANAAYALLGFTVVGLDPTAFMFTLGIFAFSWLLVTNKTMDMPSVGQSTLFDTMSEPLILLDARRQVVRSNAAAKRSRLLADPTLGHDLIAGIEAQTAQNASAHISCNERLYEPRVQPIENPLAPAGPAIGWSVTFVDVTDRIATTTALERALKEADEANRAKDEFISVVSHELRTPLTSLKGGLALALSGKLGEIKGPLRSSLDIAHRNGVRLSRLVDNILLVQKLEVQALSLEWLPVDLPALLRESIEENRMYAHERGVRLDIGSVGQPAVVLGDAFAIRQVVDNLISNAVKFSNVGDTVEGTLTTNNGRVRVSIRDHGRGIPEGMEEKVFGRFGQLDDDGQKSTQGSGLGLHISRQLARQMAGDLFYESEVGVGSTFHVEFGIGAEAETAQQAAPSALQSTD